MPFRVEVEARDAEGSITPSYGTEGTAEGIRVVSAALMVPPAGRNGSSGTGTLGGATNFSATATAGRFRNDAVTFDEVGVIRLAAAVADGDYLGGGSVAGTQSGNVGRFFPARLELVSGSVIAPSCTTFTYMSEPALGVQYRIDALEAGGQRTQNYDETLLGVNAVATLTVVAENADAGVDLGARVSGVVNHWLAGRADVATSTAQFVRVASPDGPFDALVFGARAVDPLANTSLMNRDMNAALGGDCVSAANCDAKRIGATTQVRYGRLVVKPASGPEDRDLGVPLEAQYFNGALFERNALDGCSTYAGSGAGLGNYMGNLVDGDTLVSGPVAATQLVSGQSVLAAPLLLSAPGINHDGAVDVTLDVPAHLEFDWAGAGAADPKGTARFGTYRGHDRIIFWRER
jgi:MSHA biogenesis protein MshQ